MLRRIIFIIGAVWWFGTMYFIYSGSQKGKKVTLPELDIVVVGKFEKQEWFSIYLRGEKVGYSSKSVQIVGKKPMVTDVSYLRLPVGGIVQEVYATGITTLDTDYSIQSFSFEIQGGDYITSADGKIDGNILNVKIRTGEKTDSMRFELSGKIYSPSMLPEMYASSVEKNEPIKDVPTFDPFTLSESRYEIISIKNSLRKVMGETREALILTVRAMGLESEMWISPDGELLYERGPGGFEQFRESQKSALEFDLSKSGNSDILTGFAIPSLWNFAISPRNAKYGVYLLDGFPEKILEFSDFNQKVIGDTLFVCADGFSEKNYSPNPEDTTEEPFIQCNDLRIVKAARKIVKSEVDTLKMLIKINDYLFEHIKKEYQTSIPSAVDVLRKMRGDCNEHSTLFVALARALKIPSRINIGVVYREDGYFYYHAWVQAYADGRWHTFDPTFGQYPADASHIKMLSGNLQKQIQILRLGQVGIEILKVDEKCQR
ncbi:transglutaminase domain-containing protein [bacterium]|nr:transglutaminase domain-containing protein [bacterium]